MAHHRTPQGTHQETPQNTHRQTPQETPRQTQRVVLVGSLDTKSQEYAFVAGRLRGAGLELIVVDTGVLGTPGMAADVSSAEVARKGGAELADLAAASDRGAAQEVMARGARAVVSELYAQGGLHGAFAMGGTGGTAVASAAFAGLPVGFPKVILSTAASGNTEAYVAQSDLVLVPSVVDVAGLNRISTRVMANAAAALAGMVTQAPLSSQTGRPLVAASMFGVTTEGVTRARKQLEDLGYEVVVFHMTGSGGRAMEALIEAGYFAGVLDLTTTELADELVGGVFSAGPTRLSAAGRARVPQVVSLGALDMVNFGARDTVPERFAGRTLHVHNSSVTLMRTTAAECAELGARLATRLSGAGGPAVVLIPAGGVSAISTEGGPFHDRAADAPLFEAVRTGLEGTDVEVVEVETDINDIGFADQAVARLHQMITAATPANSSTVTGAAGASVAGVLAPEDSSLEGPDANAPGPRTAGARTSAASSS